MSILKDRLKETKYREEEIAEKVSKSDAKPEGNEKEAAEKIILKVSRYFSEKMATEDISKFQNEIVRYIENECRRLTEFSFESQKRIEKSIKMTVLGNGPIEPLLKDPDVTDIVIQRYDNIVVERKGKIEKVNITFNDEKHLRTIIDRIVQSTGRQINVSTPYVDSRLRDGSRINATIPPISPMGATLTIRKFNNAVLSGDDYLKFGSLTPEMLEFLQTAVKARVSMIVSGGTGTGKTTLLNMLSQSIPKDELIITIEDTLELKLQQPNVRRMEVRLSNNESMANVDQELLVKNALRQRPDRIVLGETRDGTIVDLISAMSTGHEGSLTTIHANSPENMINVRIPILYSMNAKSNFSEKAIYMQVAEALHLIVQIRRFHTGERKIVNITHVAGINKETGLIILKDIFYYDTDEKCFKATGYIPENIIQMIKASGYDIDMKIFKKGVLK